MTALKPVRTVLRRFGGNDTLVLAAEIALWIAIGVFIGRDSGGALLAGIVATAGTAVVVLRSRTRRGARSLLVRVDERTKSIRTAVQQPGAGQSRAKASPSGSSAPASSKHDAPRPGTASVSRTAGTVPTLDAKSAATSKRQLPAAPNPQEVGWAVERAIVPRVVRVQDARQWYVPRAPEVTSLRIAAICDEFTFNSFAPEASVTPLQPSVWREQMEAERPDVFFCESAWAGVPGSEAPWRGQIYASISFPYENRSTLLDILAYCKKMDIPTVFWNKEDPTHFADRITDFVATASLFDHILTTAEECIPDYRRLLRRGNVGLLPFAAQPSLFHPDPAVSREEGAIFAGAWYAVHPDRSRDMEAMFSAIMRMGLPLAIYDRDFGLSDPQREFPEKFRHLVRPAVSHARTADLYRRHLLGVNINTVTSSRTMCARRVFELAASGTAIVTNAGPAMEEFLPGGTISVDDVATMDRSDIEQWHQNTSLTNLEHVLRNHTYGRRLSTVCDALGLAHRDPFDALARVEIVSSHEEAYAALRNLALGYDEVLLVVDAAVPSHEVGEYYTRYVGPRSAVVSQDLVRRGYVDTRSLIRVAVAHVGTGRGRGAGFADGKRMALHAQYTGSPITLEASGGLRWVTRDSTDAVVNAAELPRAIAQPKEIVTSLGVPAR